MSTLALVFDFDDTLVPDSTTKLLKRHGIQDPVTFWDGLKPLVVSGYDPTLAFLNAFLDLVGEGKRLGPLNNKKLRKFGKTLDTAFFPGLSALFKDLRAIASRYDCGIEFYIISGGLQEVIEGASLVRAHFRAVYGCQLAEKDGVLGKIKRCITFTEKTRYLFEINKGIGPPQTLRNPYLVNKDIPPEKRRIPFENMIYVGDGLTDVPCFSLMKKMGGVSFGVFNPGDESSARRGFLEFLKTDRVVSMHSPKYRRKDDLGAMLRTAVATRCATIRLEEKQPE